MVRYLYRCGACDGGVKPHKEGFFVPMFLGVAACFLELVLPELHRF